MSEKSLKSDEVPKKFLEWLLDMGCPQEDVPSLDKITDMCRGQYYMVWRSLMTRVAPKDIIANKRLQVFADDILRCQNKMFLEKSNTVMPPELSLWHQQTELKQKVADAEAKLLDEKQKLSQRREKVNAKLAQRQLAKQRLLDAQRRAWLLQNVATELREKKAQLIKTRAIGDSFSSVESTGDVESKIDRCVSLMSRHNTTGARAAPTVSNANNTSIASKAGEINETVEEIPHLLKCGGDAVFAALYERRAGLCPRIEALRPLTQDKHRSPQSVVTETADLHCTLALEHIKNKNLIKQTINQFEAAVYELSNTLTDADASELLVVYCEKAKSEARIKTLRELTEDLINSRGIFQMKPFKEGDNFTKQIKLADKNIVLKKEEILKLVKTKMNIDEKASNAKECLLNVFNSFHRRTEELTCYGSSSIPQESITTLRMFFDERRDKNKVELSFDLDVSSSSSSDIETNNPKFVDELKFYLKNFNLEKNRKLVFDSGEQIWISETVQSSLNRFYSKLLSENLATCILSPAISLAKNLELLSGKVQKKKDLEDLVKRLQGCKKKSWSFDIETKKEEEQRSLDRIKKQLHEGILTLQRTDKVVDVINDNLTFWRQNNLREFISPNRVVNGKSFREIELIYKEGLMI